MKTRLLLTSLAAMLTTFYHTKKLTIEKITELMSHNPRKLLGLEPIQIKEGAKADFILVDPDLEWVVDPDKLHSKSHNTVFKGEKFKGKCVLTVTDGIIRYKYN